MCGFLYFVVFDTITHLQNIRQSQKIERDGKKKYERRKLKIWFMHKITGSISISQLEILDHVFTLFAPPKVELLMDI